MTGRHEGGRLPDSVEPLPVRRPPEGRDYQDVERLASKSQGVEFVAISPNDPKIKEKDSAELMAQEGYPFPYLFDEAQEVAKMYKGMCTPDIYAFRNDGGELKLAYQGQLDSSRPERKGGDPSIPNNGEDLRAALDHIVAGKSVPKPWKPSIGCSIKWSEGNEPEYWGKQ